MKKLRLNKIFHWLYAFLMFLPIVTYVFQLLVFFGTGNTDSVNFGFEGFLIDTVGMSFTSGVSGQVLHCFDYLISDVLNCSQFGDGFNTLFTYWVMISCIWLVFDVLMYPINLFHRWIDEGGI